MHLFSGMCSITQLESVQVLLNLARKTKHPDTYVEHWQKCGDNLGNNFPTTINTILALAFLPNTRFLRLLPRNPWNANS